MTVKKFKKIVTLFLITTLVFDLPIMPGTLSSTAAAAENQNGVNPNNASHSHKLCGETDCICEEAETQDVDWLPWDSDNSLPDSGNYYLTKDVSLDKYASLNDVNLCLNGHVISLSSTANKSAFTYSSDGNLDVGMLLMEGNSSITDCSDTSHKFSVNENGLWVLDENGYITLTGGCITGSQTVDFEMSGIIIKAKASVTMYKGNIVGVKGNGVTARSNFTMNRGNISGNVTDRSGSGVFVDFGSSVFTMNGGEISANRAMGNGAGVYAKDSIGGRIYLNGGKITANNAGGNGGGICIPSGAGCTPVIKNAEISKNQAGDNGGGIYYENRSGNFTLENVKVINNIAVSKGSGIYYNRGLQGSDFPIQIRYKTKIMNNKGSNLYIDNIDDCLERALPLIGVVELDDEAYIGVTLEYYQGLTKYAIGTCYFGSDEDLFLEYSVKNDLSLRYGNIIGDPTQKLWLVYNSEIDSTVFTNVENLITKIPSEITLNEETKGYIDAAREAYDNLSEGQKNCISDSLKDKLLQAETTYDELEGGANNKAAKEVEEKIKAIGWVLPTPECKEKIETAREAYDSLTTVQKDMVSKELVFTLEQAEISWVIEKIDDIGTIDASTECGQRIVEARKAYDELTEEMKEQFPEESLKKLLDAEKNYDNLTGGKNQKAADDVVEKINGIGYVNTSSECGKKIEDAQKAYDSLNSTQKSMLEEGIYEKLQEAKSKYDQLKIKEVEDKIFNIGIVSASDTVKKKIESAREAYEKLTEEHKEGVSASAKNTLLRAEREYDSLTGGKQQEAAKEVEEIIKAIGTVENTPECSEKIEEARKAYENLTPTQKDMVNDDIYKILTDAESEYNKMKADEVKKKIDDIGTVTNTPETIKKIEDARDAYEKLTQEQKKEITTETKKKLTDAEKSYDELTGGKGQAAADEVKEKINAIGGVENTDDCNRKIEDARESYDNLTPAQKDMVGDETYKILTDAEQTYHKLKVDEANKKIDEIGVVENTPECGKKIQDARDAYEELTQEQKEEIAPETKKKLTDAEKMYDNLSNGGDQKAANAVMQLINNIGTVKNTEECGWKIEMARDAYDALTPTQKDMVSQYYVKILEDAEAKYGQWKTEEVKKKIDDIGTVTATEESSKKIEDARDAYEKLNEGQKKEITPETKKKLTDAEKVYDELTGGKNQTAADAVKEKITGIGTVENTPECGKKIEDARDSYDKLTSTQKDMVGDDVYKKLTDAENTYNKLKSEEVRKKIDEIGEVTDTSECGKKIEDAREAYEELSKEQKENITAGTKKKLTDAEKTRDELTGGKNQAAADAVEEKINGIGTVENTQECGKKIEDARESYNNLTPTQKDMVEDDAYKKLTDAEKEYSNFKVEEVKKKIKDIGYVYKDEQVKKKIEDAREAYEKLTEEEKKKISPDTLKTLTDAEEAYDKLTGGEDRAEAEAVKEKINAIETVEYTQEWGQKIEDARNAYNKLTSTQKNMVGDDVYKKLTDAEEKYSKWKVDEVLKKIDNIGTVTATQESLNKIEEAREAYERLTEEQKKAISDEILKKLTDAEQAYDKLTGGTNQKAADAVREKINAIGEVKNTEECSNKIKEARKAYDELTYIQKAMVGEDTYKKLTDAEAELEKLKNYDWIRAEEVVNKINAIGTVVKTDACKKKIEDARAGYNGLTAQQKALISPEVLKTLTDAESTYAKLVQGGNTGGNKPSGGNQGGSTGGNKPSGGDKPGSSTDKLTEQEKKEIKNISDKLGVPENTAIKIQKLAKELGVEPNTLLVTDNFITGQKTDNDIKGSTFGKLRAKASNTKTKSIKLTWNKVKGADGYLIFGNKCGKGKRYKLIKVIKKGSTKSFTQKKLKKGTFYKYIVRAYKMIDGKRITIAASKTIHVTTSGGKKGNMKSIKLNKKSVKLKKGKTFKIKAKEVKQSKPLGKHRKVCFESSNKSIATVSKKGVIKAKKKGSCTIYVYGQNGVYKTVKVKIL